MACSLLLPLQNAKKKKKRWNGDVGEGPGENKKSGMLGEVSSFDFFFLWNVFKIKLDMTFSRLPVEKYFLIPEGALGEWNSLATRLAWQPGLPGQVGGKIKFHGVHCNTLHRIFR